MPNNSSCLNKTDSTENSKKIIEYRFFEFQKMRTFLEKGFGVHLGRDHYVPFQIVPDYINSLLLVDLLSIWELAVDYILKKNGLVKVGSSERNIKLIEEKGFLLQPRYIKWYTTLRNDVAHRNSKIELYKVAQATEDIKNQLVSWNLITDLRFSQFTLDYKNDKFETGVRIDIVVILKYSVEFKLLPAGMSKGWSETVNLNFEEYLKMKEKSENLIR